MFENVTANSDVLVQRQLPLYVSAIGMRDDFPIRKKQYVSQLSSDFVALTFCCEGHGDAFVMDRRFPMQPGDVVIYYPNEKHAFWGYTNPCRIAWINLQGALAFPILVRYGFPRYIKLVDGFPRDLFDRIAALMRNGDFLDCVSATTCIFKLFEYFVRSQNSNHSQHVLMHSRELILQRLSDPDLNVNNICDELGIHRATFSKKFTAEFHCGPRTYIQDQRLQQARKLLLVTDLPISEIGRRCGYPEKTAFSRFFKKSNHGVSPREYRSAALKGNG